MDKSALYGFVKNITPPVIFSAFVKSALYPTAKKLMGKISKEKYTPSWNTIKHGPLKGKQIFADPSGDWQKEMIEGSYDDFFFTFADKIQLEGKTVFDIGAHIGFSSLYFAERVGIHGKVFTFEPNPWNVERIETIFSKNADSKEQVVIVPKAISDKVGETDFIFTDNIEGGTSSGSFIEHASTLYDKSGYEEKGGFKRMKVATLSLDDFTVGASKPDLIKIDIEGGEYLALEGGEKTITTHHPILLIEIHSIYNMFKSLDMLMKWNYKIELLKEEKDGRCFIAAVYVSKE